MTILNQINHKQDKMKKSTLLLVAIMFALSSCVDENYNLSNLDTTVGVNVEKLTIPMNVDSLVLDQVLDMEDNSHIKKVVVNGKKIYAFVEEGSFKSGKIEIPGFTTDSPNINPIKAKLNKGQRAQNSRRRGIGRNSERPLGIYPLSNITTSFRAKGEVDRTIKGIHKINVDAAYNMKIDVSDNALMSKVDKISFEGVKAKLPKGLEGNIEIIADKAVDLSSLYDSSTGILDISAEKMTPELEEKLATCLTTEKGTLELKFSIDAIDIDKASGEIKFENGIFEYIGNIKVEEGDIAIYSDELKEEITYEELPNTIDYLCTPKLQEIVVEKLSGDIQYDIEGIKIDALKLSGLPNLFAQDETNIELANPQIYLKIINPLANDNIYAEAGLEMVAKRENQKDKSSSLDDEVLKMDKMENLFCLTSDKNIKKEEMAAEYKNAKVIPFIGLSSILSGNGLPDEININVLDPNIPKQKISDFKLDQKIDPIEGTYMFFAPLALKDANSCIVYTDTIDGWHNETIEKLTITEVVVNTNVKSDVPLNLALTFLPVDVNGNVFKNVKTTKMMVAATNKMQPIEFGITGEIKGLDGLIIRALLTGSNGETIAPDQKLTFNDLKITVSGQYVDEL